MGRPDVTGAYRMLAEAFRQAPEVPDVWMDRLAHEPPVAVLDTAERLIDKCEWMPTLGQFVIELKARTREDAVRAPKGWRVARHCGRCEGTGWVEVDQEGSSMAVSECPSCDGSGEGIDLDARVTPPEEAKEHLARLRKVLAETPITKRVP